MFHVEHATEMLHQGGEIAGGVVLGIIDFLGSVEPRQHSALDRAARGAGRVVVLVATYRAPFELLRVNHRRRFIGLPLTHDVPFPNEPRRYARGY